MIDRSEKAISRAWEAILLRWRKALEVTELSFRSKEGTDDGAYKFYADFAERN